MDEKLLGEHFQIFETFIVSMMVMQETDLFALKKGLDESIFEHQGFDLRLFQRVLDLKKGGLTDVQSESKEVQFIFEHLRYDADSAQISTTNDYVRSLIGQYKLERSRAQSELQKQYSLLVVNACSVFEILIGSLLAFELLHVYSPKAYVAKQTITFEGLLAAGSIENVHAELIEAFIRRSQYASVASWLNDYLKICTTTKIFKNKFDKNEDDFQTLITRIFEMRNIFVHNNGIATERYQKLGGTTDIGSQISLSEKQVLEVIDAILDTGIRLFMLNLEKNHQCRESKYRIRLNNLPIDYLRHQPKSFKVLYDYLIGMAILDGSDVKKSQDECVTYLMNVWLCYHFLATDFNVELTNYREAIHFLNDGMQAPNLKFELWWSLVQKNQHNQVTAAIKFLESFDSLQQKLNNSILPIFDILKQDEMFVEYIKYLKYNS